MVTRYNYGSNVCGIIGLPWQARTIYSDDRGRLEDVKKLIEETKHRYIFAITANFFQADSVALLKELGFREVIEIYSSHGISAQTLTLWVKTQKKYEDYSNEPIGVFPYNCTVSFGREANYNYLTLMVKKPEEKDEDLKKEGFKRVRGTPIYFRLNRPDKIVKKKEIEKTSK